MIISPSSSRMIRSTPWVEGCWGPMLRIISSVRSGPSATTSMPPPRSIQASLAAVNAARSLTSISEQGNRGPSAQLCQHLTCSGLLADGAQLVEDCQRATESGSCFGIATARDERLRARQLGAGRFPPRSEVGGRVMGTLEEWEGVIQVLGTCGGRPTLQPIGEGGQRDGAAGKGVSPGALDGGAVSAKFVDVPGRPEHPPREAGWRLFPVSQRSLGRARRSERSIPVAQPRLRDHGPRAAVQLHTRMGAGSYPFLGVTQRFGVVAHVETRPGCDSVHIPELYRILKLGNELDSPLGVSHGPNVVALVHQDATESVQGCGSEIRPVQTTCHRHGALPRLFGLRDRLVSAGDLGERVRPERPAGEQPGEFLIVFVTGTPKTDLEIRRHLGFGG